MASETTTFCLKINDWLKMVTPTNMLKNMFDHELLNPGWSALEIHRTLFQVKIGQANKVRAFFNLIPCVQPGGILRDITQFNARYSVDFKLSLEDISEIILRRQNNNEHMIMYHVNDNDVIAIVYEDDPSTVIPLPARKQRERLAQFSTHALLLMFCVTIESSLLPKKLLRFLNKHSQNEDPVMIEVTREKVVFFVGEVKSPDLSISFTTEECDIEMDRLVLHYKATVTWDNRNTLAEVSMYYQKARLHCYQNPYSTEHCITWSFIFQPDDYHAMQDPPTEPDTDNIGSSSAPLQMQEESSEPDPGAPSSCSPELQMQEAPNVPDVINHEANLTVPDVINDEANLTVPNVDLSSFGDLGFEDASPYELDVSDSSSSSQILHKAVFDHDVGANSSSLTRSQKKDVGVIGGILFVYYPKMVKVRHIHNEGRCQEVNTISSGDD